MIYLTYDVKWHRNEIFIGKIFKNCIDDCNVHEMHIIQVFLMMILLGFEEKDEKYDLLIIIIIEFCEIVLLQHKIQHNLINYEIRIYNVHIVTHVSKLNSILFKRNVNYDLKVLKVNNNAQSLHNCNRIWVILKRKRKKVKKQYYMRATTATAEMTTTKR